MAQHPAGNRHLQLHSNQREHIRNAGTTPKKQSHKVDTPCALCESTRQTIFEIQQQAGSPVNQRRSSELPKGWVT